LLLFSERNISQGNVAMPYSMVQYLKNYFIANLQMNLSVQEFRKLVCIWRSYRQKFSVLVHSVYAVTFCYWNRVT